MKRLVAQAMEQGALGLSTSLQYVPDRFASTEEIVELAKVARAVRRHLFHAPAIGKRRGSSNRSTKCSHRREARDPRRDLAPEDRLQGQLGQDARGAARIEAARARGLDVTANQYPYTRASNGLDACLPLWVREGGIDTMLARLTDPATRERIKRRWTIRTPRRWENQWYGASGGDGVMLASVLNPELRKYEGMTLTADRQSDGQGSARRGDGSGHRRSRRKID